MSRHGAGVRIAEILIPMAVATMATTACSKSPPDGGQGAPANAGRDAGTASTADGPAKAPPSAAPASSSSEWHGSYDSVAATIQIPPQLKGVKWVVPETDAGLGAGTIQFAVDRRTGRIRGAVEGPLGPATIEGYADGATMSAKVARKDPTDRGFTGTLDAEEVDGGVSGTLHVALAEVSAVRAASFHMTQAAPGGAGSIAR